MLREGIFLCFWALCLSAAYSQPVSCTGGEHCSDGYFCDTDIGQCKECLKCQDLRRQPLSNDNRCVKSINKCGQCFEGYVSDRLGDVNSPCVLAGSAESGATPTYVWWLIGVTVLTFLSLMIGIIVYIWKNPDVLKLKSGPSVTVSTNIGMAPAPRASAPEAPPPYYSAVRTAESPCPPTHEGGYLNEFHDEEGLLIKPQSQVNQSGQRVSEANQAARVYNIPVYDRAVPPPAPETPPIVTELNDNLAIHNEETASNHWIPNSSSDGDINANVSGPVGETNPGRVTGAGLSEQLALARDTTLIVDRPPKRQRRSSPSSNNRNWDNNPSDDNGQANFSASQNGPSCNLQINVVQYNHMS